jgi:hypothetical protein
MMKALVTFAFCALLVGGTAAFADANSAAVAKAIGLKPPRVYTGIYTPGQTKQGSFSPAPGGTKRRVYGAPIQSPIFKMQPKPKKPTVPPVPKKP